MCYGDDDDGGYRSFPYALHKRVYMSNKSLSACMRLCAFACVAVCVCVCVCTSVFCLV